MEKRRGSRQNALPVIAAIRYGRVVLKKIARQTGLGAHGPYAIIASKYNARYVEGMVRAAKAELTRTGAAGVKIVRVPGAFEIPIVAARLARLHSPPFSAVLCLGVILRGETQHAQHIGETVTQALMGIQLQHGVPVIHEVLLLENREQARVRCLSRKYNRGREAAQTALEMARVLHSLSAK
jgi:6,7-dimethyl-8-ribityllumazine synthase